MSALVVSLLQQMVVMTGLFLAMTRLALLFLPGLAAFAFRRYVSAAIDDRFWHDHQGEGSMTLMSRRPVEGIA